MLYRRGGSAVKFQIKLFIFAGVALIHRDKETRAITISKFLDKILRSFIPLYIFSSYTYSSREYIDVFI